MNALHLKSARKLLLALAALVVLVIPAGMAVDDSGLTAFENLQAAKKVASSGESYEEEAAEYPISVEAIREQLADSGTLEILTSNGNLTLILAEEQFFLPGENYVIVHNPNGTSIERPFTGRFFSGAVKDQPLSTVRILVDTQGLYGVVTATEAVYSLQPAYDSNMTLPSGQVPQQVTTVSATSPSLVQIQCPKNLDCNVPTVPLPCDTLDCNIELCDGDVHNCVPDPCGKGLLGRFAVPGLCGNPVPCTPATDCIPDPCDYAGSVPGVCGNPIPCQPAISCVPNYCLLIGGVPGICGNPPPCGDSVLKNCVPDTCRYLGDVPGLCENPLPTCQDLAFPIDGTDPCDPCPAGIADCIPTCGELLGPIPATYDFNPCNPCPDGVDNCVPTCEDLLHTVLVTDKDFDPCNPCPGGIESCTPNPCELAPIICCPGGIQNCIPSCDELIAHRYNAYDVCNPCDGDVTNCLPCGEVSVECVLDPVNKAVRAVEAQPAPRLPGAPGVGVRPGQNNTNGSAPGPDTPPYWMKLKMWGDLGFWNGYSDWDDRIASAYYAGDDMWDGETQIRVMFYAIEGAPYNFAQNPNGCEGGGQDDGWNVFQGWVEKFVGPNAYGLFEAGIDPGSGDAGCSKTRRLSSKTTVNEEAVHVVVAKDWHTFDSYDPDETHDRAVAANHELSHNAGADHDESGRGTCDQNLMDSDSTFWCTNLWRTTRTVSLIRDYTSENLSHRA